MANVSFVLIGSEGGSLLNALLEKSLFNKYIIQTVSNSSCGFISNAQKWNIPTFIVPSDSISQYLIETFEKHPHLYILNYSTILFTDQFVDAFMGRAYNCHPSLLPAFKGLKAIHNNFASNTLFMGCSIHQIESKIDEGNCILQAALPMNREDSFQKKRNLIFEAQLVTTIQFMRWCLNDRITTQDGHAFVTNGLFESSNYSPNLDKDIHSFMNKST